jgi:hypothetical protein
MITTTFVSMAMNGYTRFSQYNTPYENQCGGTKAKAYVFRTYKYNPDPTGKLPMCSREETTLNNQFMSQVTINGTAFRSNTDHSSLMPPLRCAA